MDLEDAVGTSRSFPVPPGHHGGTRPVTDVYRRDPHYRLLLVPTLDSDCKGTPHLHCVGLTVWTDTCQRGNFRRRD